MDKSWYYMTLDREKFGPYSDEELVALIRSGELTKNEYIWTPGLEHWLNVGNSVYASFLPENMRKVDDTIS